MATKKPYGDIKVVEDEHADDARKLLQLVVNLTVPIMDDDGILIDTIYEIDPVNGPDRYLDMWGELLGVYHPYKNKLGILLRDTTVRDGRFFRDFPDITSVMLHELSHASLYQHGEDIPSVDPTGGHGPLFYQRLHNFQEYYYRIHSTIKDHPSNFIPSDKTIGRILERFLDDAGRAILISVGMDNNRMRITHNLRDYITDVRQYAIERKLDSEAAEEVGEYLDHYRYPGTKRQLRGIGAIENVALNGGIGQTGTTARLPWPMRFGQDLAGLTMQTGGYLGQTGNLIPPAALGVQACAGNIMPFAQVPFSFDNQSQAIQHRPPGLSKEAKYRISKQKIYSNCERQAPAGWLEPGQPTNLRNAIYRASSTCASTKPAKQCVIGLATDDVLENYLNSSRMRDVTSLVSEEA